MGEYLPTILSPERDSLSCSLAAALLATCVPVRSETNHQCIQSDSMVLMVAGISDSLMWCTVTG